MKIRKIRRKEPQIICSTWQSLYKLPKKEFEGYDVVIGDEAHNFKAKSLTSIMTKLCDAKYRFGFTGTLDGTETHKWILEGLFGPSYKLSNTSDLIEQGYLAELDIKILLLKHQHRRFNTYNEEIEYLIGHSERNKFIKNLSLELKGNTLVLYNRVETHGKLIYDLINSDERVGSKKVFFIHGGIDVKEREEAREIAERENNAIIVASYGTFSTGINIKNLSNIVFASPSKSRIRNLQSIGRGLRKTNTKTKAKLYDISDDIKDNYTLGHLMERIKIYNQENFNYKIINITLKNE